MAEDKLTPTHKAGDATTTSQVTTMPPVDPADKPLISPPSAEKAQGKIDRNLGKSEKARQSDKEAADERARRTAARDDRMRLHDRPDLSAEDRARAVPPKVRVVDTTEDARPIVTRSMPSAAERQAAEVKRDAEIRERANARAIAQAEVDSATNAASFLPYKEEDSNPGL